MATTSTTITRVCSQSSPFVYTHINSAEGKLCVMTARSRNPALRNIVSIAGSALPCGISVTREVANILIRAARRSSNIAGK